MSKAEQYKNYSLCWSCKNAVPKVIEDKRTGKKRHVQGCPWSIYTQPVKGWDADKSTMNVNGRTRDTYYVRSCPLFERGRC